MRVRGIATAAIVIASTGAASAATGSGTLSPAQFKATFGTGKAFSTISASGRSQYWFTFNKDGTASAVRKGQNAAATGTWRVSSDGYCTTWTGSTEHCYTVQKNGAQYDVRDHRGYVVAHFSLTAPGTGGASGTATGRLADGAYTGPVVNAYYGLMQIQAIIKGGRLASIRVLKYPNDRRTSVYINRQALPMLRNEVIAAQSANVNIISGATLSSEAFIQSLGAAMNKAGG